MKTNTNEFEQLNAYDIVWKVYNNNLPWEEIINIVFPAKIELSEILKNGSTGSLVEIEDMIEFQIVKLSNSNKCYLITDCGFGIHNMYSLDVLKSMYEEYLKEMNLKEKAKAEAKDAKEKAKAEAKAAKEKAKAEAKVAKEKAKTEAKAAKKSKGFINTLF